MMEVLIQVMVAATVLAVLALAIWSVMTWAWGSDTSVIERLRGIRTLAAGALTTGTGIAMTVLQEVYALDLSLIVPAQWLPYILFGLGLATILLRIATHTSVGHGD
jgi:hypothetical protein